MKALLKKSAILKTISSKISTYLHAIDADPQEDDSDFDDEEYAMSDLLVFIGLYIFIKLKFR